MRFSDRNKDAYSQNFIFASHLNIKATLMMLEAIGQSQLQR